MPDFPNFSAASRSESSLNAEDLPSLDEHQQAEFAFHLSRNETESGLGSGIDPSVSRDATGGGLGFDLRILPRAPGRGLTRASSLRPMSNQDRRGLAERLENGETIRTLAGRLGITQQQMRELVRPYVRPFSEEQPRPEVNVVANAARERLDEIRNHPTMTHSAFETAHQALQPASIAQAARDQNLAPALSNETGVLNWALNRAGLDAAQRHELQQPQNGQPVASHNAVDPATHEWEYLRSQAVASAEQEGVIEPGWAQRTAEAGNATQNPARETRAASDDLSEDRPSQRARLG